MAKVSVVVTSYNHACFLRQRLDSILAQSYRDYELILLDDASTDSSSGILTEYAAHPNVTALLINAENSGSPFIQWNLGVSRAQGDYVWIAESDDWCLPDFLESLVTILDSDPRIGIASCRSMLIDGSGAAIGDSADDQEQVFGSARWRESFRHSGLEECRRYLTISNSIPNASAVLFRRASYEKVGGANTELQLCGDWSTWVRILLSSPDVWLAYIAEPLNRMRSHPASVRERRHSRRLMESFGILGEIDALVSLTPEERTAALEARCRDWSWQTLGSQLDAGVQQETLEAAQRSDPHVFARLTRHLGERGVDQNCAVAWLEERLEDRERTVAWLKEKLEDRERTVAWLKEKLEDRERTVAWLKEKLEDRERTVAWLKEKLEDRERTVAWLKEKVVDKDHG
jgi:glycosyltransferase involved in cell wall biosynthesis